MYGSSPFYCSLWWVVPVIMMILCFLMMRRRRGSILCGFGPRTDDNHQGGGPNSAREILDKRYVTGEIEKDVYEEKKRTLTE